MCERERGGQREIERDREIARDRERSRKIARVATKMRSKLIHAAAATVCGEGICLQRRKS